MTIETRYSINDTVYILHYGELAECTITSLNIEVNYKKDAEIKYNLTSTTGAALIKGYAQEDVFPSKKDIAMHWLVNQGLDIEIKDK